MKVVVEVVVVAVVDVDMDEDVAVVVLIASLPTMSTHLVVTLKMEKLEGRQKNVVDMVDLVVAVAVVVVFIMEILLMVNALVVHLNGTAELAVGEFFFQENISLRYASISSTLF